MKLGVLIAVCVIVTHVPRVTERSPSKHWGILARWKKSHGYVYIRQMYVLQPESGTCLQTSLRLVNTNHVNPPNHNDPGKASAPTTYIEREIIWKCMGRSQIIFPIGLTKLCSLPQPNTGTDVKQRKLMHNWLRGKLIYSFYKITYLLKKVENSYGFQFGCAKTQTLKRTLDRWTKDLFKYGHSSIVGSSI